MHGILKRVTDILGNFNVKPDHNIFSPSNIPEYEFLTENL